LFVLLATSFATVLAGGNIMSEENPVPGEAPIQRAGDPQEKLETVTFGSGCFWCTEAVFAELNGVDSAVSGYSGGRVANPTYEQVCTGRTGHAEVIQVTFDPKVITFPELLEVFWHTHDPTTLNMQGPDHGTQYRSAIFYHNEEQRRAAERYKKRLNDEQAFDAPVVTEITKFTKFYPAEDDHQDYFKLNPRQDYCRAIIQPKVAKFRKAFADKLKVNAEKKAELKENDPEVPQIDSSVAKNRDNDK
jgi:methionine-S-sulfoxide reductase